MLKKVENYIRQWKMLEKGDKVVVGLSGGADSVCLFLILEELRKKDRIWDACGTRESRDPWGRGKS